MSVIIKIETENDAFKEAGENREVGRILKRLANSFEVNAYPNKFSFKLFDINGNSCGTVKIGGG